MYCCGVGLLYLNSDTQCVKDTVILLPVNTLLSLSNYALRFSVKISGIVIILCCPLTSVHSISHTKVIVFPLSVELKITILTCSVCYEFKLCVAEVN